MSRASLHLLASALIASGLVACGGETDTPVGEIVNVTGNLYEARTATHNTVFLVTPDGIILSDPINLEFAQWLETEFAARFDVPVAYVIYSHHHPDHTVGGIVFEDTATFIAHEAVVTARGAPLPSNAVALDLDGDGRLHRTEATGLAYNRDFDHYNQDEDDVITNTEIYADAPAPDVVYADRMAISLGGSTVELIHPGPAHSDDMTVLYFPEEGAVFGVDFMHVNRFPATLGGYPVARYAEAIARVQALDYEIAILGHGEIGEKADLGAFLEFLRALETAVAGGIAEGRSVEDLQENLEFPAYEDWLLYDTRRRTLIAETYALLTGA